VEIVVVIVTMAMNDHNLVVVLIVTIMMKHDNLVVLIVTVMMTNLDNFAMMIPIPVPVLIADVDGYAAFLSDHDRLVDCGRPGQRRSAQDCKRARDKYQFVHVTFLHGVMFSPLRRRQPWMSSGLRVTRRGKPGKRWLVPLHSKKYACKSKNSPGNEHVFRKLAHATPDRPLKHPDIAELAALSECYSLPAGTFIR
jgi:hypothetical protein